MPDDYLWDRTGEPDREIQRLESLLSPYRQPAPRLCSRQPRRLPLIAVLAAVAACLAVIWVQTRPRLSDWQIGGQHLAIGRVIQTGRDSHAQLEAESFGQVELEPNSRLQVLSSTTGTQRLALQRGTLHALIWAPPARFTVETASARTIDLGCSYTLTVAPDDTGLLTVQTGWVAFQNGPVESFIPSGAACRTRPVLGPGLPYFDDASPALQQAISQFDSTSGRLGVSSILAQARPHDALTLWHLLLRTSGPAHDAVIQRFTALVPGVDAAGLRANNATAIDQAWNQLGLGETDWWRQWKHSWQQPGR